jgi:hypothetical protein
LAFLLAPYIVAMLHAAEHEQGNKVIRKGHAVNYFEEDRVMEVVYKRCCGLDIHKASIAACEIIHTIVFENTAFYIIVQRSFALSNLRVCGKYLVDRLTCLSKGAMTWAIESHSSVVRSIPSR